MTFGALFRRTLLPAQGECASHPDEASTVKVDIAVMAISDVPEQNRFAETVIWRLGERARASNGAATVVEPVSRDVPAGNFGHDDLDPLQYDDGVIYATGTQCAEAPAHSRCPML